MSTEYVLGTGNDELERLGLQSRLWADAAHAAWKIGCVAPGQRILDVGCGPGFAAFDLALIAQSSGRVVGVDESAPFIDYANDQAAARHLPHFTAHEGDVQRLGPVLTAAGHREPFDFAWARWVLCFVPNPSAVIAGVAAALKHGGRFVIHDYFNYETMTPAPRRESYTKAVAATAKSWRERGGDPDIVARIPRLLKDQGLRLDHLAVHQRLARPHETMWHWADRWWKNYVPKLVTMGLLTPEDERQFFVDMDSMTSETDFLVLPPVYEVVATKL